VRSDLRQGHSRRVGAAALAIALAVTGCGDNQTHPPPDHGGYGGGSGDVPLSCVPNLDGRIDATEMKATLGVPVTFLVSPPNQTRPVDLAGTVDDAGKRTWDWSADVASDRTAQIEATALEGKWYASSFPKGQFVTPLDAAGTLENVYAEDDAALWLLGVASAEKDPPSGRTLLVYTAPIALYRFPLEVGSTWVSTGEIVGGKLHGFPYAGKDVYEVKDLATGQLVLRDLTFTQAHRVQTRVTVSPATGKAVSTRQDSFLFECFGEVARATSEPNEPKDDFTTAAEVRRLGL
jgi:hypothetical protein